MDIAGLKKYVVDRLKSECSPDLHYHSVFHTLDVLDAAERLMTLHGTDFRMFQIVQAAALLHEMGMIKSYADHETASADIARKICPEFELSPSEIDLVVQHIMATKMPQTPVTITEKILCDADLDYLGRSDYQIISHKLRLEWIKVLKYPESLVVWYNDQLEFLSNHQYFTHLAHSLRDQGKKHNLELIKAMLDHQ